MQFFLQFEILRYSHVFFRQILIPTISGVTKNLYLRLWGVNLNLVGYMSHVTKKLNKLCLQANISNTSFNQKSPGQPEANFQKDGILGSGDRKKNVL